MENKTFNEWRDEAHALAVEKGWYEGETRKLPELLMLCVSELSEALEEHRTGKRPDETYSLGDGKPEGVPTELADCIIRILDICGYYGIDIQTAMERKHAYNKTRPYRHGGKVV